MEQQNDDIINPEPSLAYDNAADVMTSLEGIWTDVFQMGSAEDLLDKFVGPMVRMPEISTEDMMRILGEIMDSPADELAAQIKKSMPRYASPSEKELSPEVSKIRMIELAMFEIVCLLVVQAVSASVRKAPEKEQWDLACEARRRLGMLQGYILGNREARNRISAIGRSGADVIHAENRAMKQQAFDWLASNLDRFKSMESAARALEEVVPLTPRTLVGYVKAFKKSQKPE